MRREGKKVVEVAFALHSSHLFHVEFRFLSTSATGDYSVDVTQFTLTIHNWPVLSTTPTGEYSRNVAQCAFATHSLHLLSDENAHQAAIVLKTCIHSQRGLECRFLEWTCWLAGRWLVEPAMNTILV